MPVPTIYSMNGSRDYGASELTSFVFHPEQDTSDDAIIKIMSKTLQSCSGLIAQMEEKHGELSNQARVPRDAVVRLLKPK